jgi:hypothetical protein
MKHLLILALSLIVCQSGFSKSPIKADTLIPPDFTKISISDFSDEELDLPYYVANFYRVANSVLMEGPNKGYINIAVWRGTRDNKPYNARIMESILSLVYFYCTNKSWNPYYANPILRVRLEAALEFWCSKQSPGGAFSEYEELRWGLAPTAFATKFMGESLRLLKSGPAINNTLLKKVIMADRKAIQFVLTDSAFFVHGSKYTNQFTNVFAGGLAYLDLYPDSALKNLLYAKIKSCHLIFQSPVGYFYEAGGIDWGYNLNTHHSNLLMMWNYAKNTSLEPYLKEEETRYVDWFSYNAVPEPDKSGYVLNRAIECRQRQPFFENYGSIKTQQPSMFNYSLAPLSAAFIMNQEQYRIYLDNTRAKLKSEWPNVGQIESGNFNSFSPYQFLHRTHIRYFPTQKEQDAATSLLPYNKKSLFIQQRMDSRVPMVFTYVKRMNYYAAFNSGKIVQSQQRYGLGLLWLPTAGTLIQSQTGTNNASWGTIPDGNTECIESKDIFPVFSLDSKSVTPKIGIADLAGKLLQVSYPLKNLGTKTIKFNEDNISVDVQCNGKFKEILPILLKQNEVLTISDKLITIIKNGKTILINTNASKLESKITSYTCGNNKVYSVTLEATNRLSYSFSFSN